jgi:hypothetical protein
LSLKSAIKKFRPLIEHCERRDLTAAGLTAAAKQGAFAPAQHEVARVQAAQLTAYSMVAIRNDTAKEIKFTLRIETSSGKVVFNQQFTVAPRGGIKPIDWTSNVGPSFTVTYTSFVTAGKPFVKDQPVTSHSKDLPKPPTLDQVKEFGSIWRFRSSGIGVSEVVTLEAERI